MGLQQLAVVHDGVVRAQERVEHDRLAGAPHIAGNVEYGAQEGTPWGIRREILQSPLGLPCTAPPYGSLHGIDMHERPRTHSHALDELRQRLDGTDLIVGPLQADEDGLVGERSSEIIGVDAAIAVDWQTLDLEAVLLEQRRRHFAVRPDAVVERDDETRLVVRPAPGEQAAKLWLKKTPFFRKPEPPENGLEAA